MSASRFDYCSGLANARDALVLEVVGDGWKWLEVVESGGVPAFLLVLFWFLRRLAPNLTVKRRELLSPNSNLAPNLTVKRRELLSLNSNLAPNLTVKRRELLSLNYILIQICPGPDSYIPRRCRFLAGTFFGLGTTSRMWAEPNRT